ncbi:MAG: chromosome segregation protein ScpA [Sphingobacteriaceae bacterium]|nr:MAG: chromosome segregation protein ScpA [Sphingobacteriaceae bacterium]
MTEENFEIKLPQFEGPFDLLLFFIERDELNIHDIPIARIADDFLSYLHHMTSLNMEVASEFIFVAATLMRIKAKMLLPRFETDENGNEVDTKEELIRKLVEYKRFKDLCEELRPVEEERLKQEKRGNIAFDIEQMEKVTLPGEELSEVSLYKLMLVYERVMRNLFNRRDMLEMLQQELIDIQIGLGYNNFSISPKEI